MVKGYLGFFTSIFVCFAGLNACALSRITHPEQTSNTAIFTATDPTVTPSGTATPTVIHPYLFMDENPIIGIRQGPGCEYLQIQQAVTRSDPARPLNVLGRHEDWRLIDLGNGIQGWVFGPIFEDNSYSGGTADDLPDIQAPSTALISPTQPTSNNIDMTEEAGQTLVDFFDSLYTHRYQEASDLFGTSYNWPIMWNPDANPLDHSALLEAGCEVNGFDCLRVNRIVKRSQVSNHEFLFTVEFLNENGDVYHFRGPSVNDQEPPSQFRSRVVRDCDGRYFVVTYPVYGG